MIIQFWIRSPRNTRKAPSYPAHFRIAAFGCQRAYCPSAFSLELCLQLCIHKLPKLNALCHLAVGVLNSGVERKRASSEHSLTPRSATGCMSSRHRGRLSVVVGAVTKSSRSDLVFTKAVLSCVTWSSPLFPLPFFHSLFSLPFSTPLFPPPVSTSCFHILFTTATLESLICMFA